MHHKYKKNNIKYMYTHTRIFFPKIKTLKRKLVHNHHFYLYPYRSEKREMTLSNVLKNGIKCVSFIFSGIYRDTDRRNAGRENPPF